MPDKKECSLPALRLTEKLKVAIKDQAIKEHRDIRDMARILLAEAICSRQAKDNTLGYM